MGFWRSLSGDWGARWRLVRDRGAGGERRCFAALELLCFLASFLTLFGVLPANIACARMGWAAPGWWSAASMVLLSAAVGYITNYIAIEMLFKPYVRSAWHPLSLMTCGYWKQGLVPRSKDYIGREMGRQLESRLLNPEQLADELCGMVMGFIQDPAVVGSFRGSVQKLLHDHERNIIGFFIPQIEKSLEAVVSGMLTVENLNQFWESGIAPFLSRDENRRFIAARIVESLQRRAPEFTQMLKSEMRGMCRSYLERKMPLGLGAEKLSDGLVECVNWDEIEARLRNRIGEERTLEMLRDELKLQVAQMNGFLRTPEGVERMECFVEGIRARFRQWLHRYLPQLLPSVAREALDSERLWLWLEHDMLPTARPGIEALIREQGKERIVAKLNLAQRVSSAVERQDVREFHEMVNAVCAQHLGAIQVMGYFLGLIVGLLQLLIP